MAVRVDNAEVLKIISTSLDTERIDRLIETANLIVNEYLQGEGPSDTLLEEIELYLTAHLVASDDKRTSQESADGLSFRYEGETGMGLESTRYGQHALLLDTTGKLKQISNQKSALIFKATGY